MAAASDAVFAYYRHVADQIGDEPDFPVIADPAAVWEHVELTNQPDLEHDGTTWFVVLENECDWEPEHGLMIVLRQGREVTKVSSYDGHLTNQRAYGDDSIPASAVYWNPYS